MCAITELEIQAIQSPLNAETYKSGMSTNHVVVSSNVIFTYVNGLQQQ